MSVIEQEKVTTVVTVPATQLEDDLWWMLEQVKKGKWCRDTVENGLGQHCTHGLMMELLHVRDTSSV